MPDPIPLKRQIQAVGREIGMRRSVYPKFVASGRFTQAQADDELATMNAVYRTLKVLEGLQNGTLDETTKKPAAEAPKDSAMPGGGLPVDA